MSRHRKSRRHRKVNMTPRPVGPRRSPRSAQEQASTGDTRVPRAESPIPGQNANGDEVGLVSRRVNESGLSRHAVRTWQGLTEAGSGGAGVAELIAAVGFQRSTVLGHLKGLAELGLAEDRGDVWVANGPVEDASARQGVRVPAGVGS
ncbi:hypothetical protein [Streptomyces sp. NPDC002580]|uniref:hypothetical protein n=1 Tax=Streptomyces sp. NPDC002580 TaxID=3364653 RepID=UPI00368380A6